MTKAKAGKGEPKVGASISKKAEQVKVVDQNGELVREYSLKVHGEDFLTLAEEFAGKVGGRKVVE